MKTKHYRFFIFALLLVLISVLSWTVAAASDIVFDSAGFSERPGVVESNGVKEINLSNALSEPVLYAEDAWMLTPNVCVVQCQVQDESGVELVLVDLASYTVMSRTLLSEASWLYRQGWENEAFYLLYNVEYGYGEEEQPIKIKVSITAEGQVSTSSVPSSLMYMPGDGVAIRGDGSGGLLAVDTTTGSERYLLQGVTDMMAPEGDESPYDQYLKYVPCADDVGYDGKDMDGFELPFQHPLDEEGFYDNMMWFGRFFSMRQPLDEHRFVYAASGWEWGAGFGVYDLSTNTDHRITGRGYLYDLAGNMLFGSTLKADINTYETYQLPEAVQEQFAQVSAMEDGIVNYDLSPDGALLALTGLRSRDADHRALIVTDTTTGDLVRGYVIDNPSANENRVSFYGDENLMLLFTPEEPGEAYLYLVDLQL